MAAPHQARVRGKGQVHRGPGGTHQETKVRAQDRDSPVSPRSFAPHVLLRLIEPVTYRWPVHQRQAVLSDLEHSCAQNKLLPVVCLAASCESDISCHFLRGLL